MSGKDFLSRFSTAIPDKLALIEDPPAGHKGDRIRWTFRELNAEVNRLANVLLGLGVLPGNRVIWCGPNSSGVVRMVHASRKIGATAVPMNYRLTAEEASYVVDNSDATIAYIDAEYVDLFASIRDEIPKLRQVLVFGGEAGPGMLDADRLIAEADAGEPERKSGEAGETMIYTSGTTGRPKGAVRSGVGSVEQNKAFVEFFGYTHDDVYLTTGPIYHSAPGGFMVIAHSLGNTVVLQRKYDPEDWLRLIDEFRVTTSFAAPTPVRMACSLPSKIKERYDVSCMKRFLANAAPWSWALKEAYLDDFPEDSLFEIYGSTELGVNTILRPEDQRRKKGSCGRPAPLVELALFSEEGERIDEPHVEGELYASSPSLFSRYHKAEDKYEEDRRGDFHTVGDVAYFDDEGYFYICDRKKDMIISGGVNIYPAEVEAALEGHPDVLDVAVFGVPDEEWGESVHAEVVVRADGALSSDDLVAFARDHLAGFKVPRSVAFRDEIPRNGSGKILKKELRAPYWAGRDRGVA